MQGIAAAVGPVRGWVMRELQSARLPRHLPWGRALFEHFDDLVGDLLPKVAFGKGGGL